MIGTDGPTKGGDTDMKHLTLDVENTVVKRNGKLHLDPFEPESPLWDAR